MKKKFSPIAILMLILVLLLCSCGTTLENENEETTIPTETVEETTEAEAELDPEWLSDAAIDEAYACLFPSEGEINVEKAQGILLPLVEAGNAEAQYYWGYIYDLLFAENSEETEKEALYWYKLAAEQGFPKAYLGAALNGYIDSEDRKNELIDSAKRAGLFDLPSEELGADGCDLVAYYYLHNNDFTSAAEWFFKAAELGCTYGMMNYGQMHYYNLGVEQDYIIATDWLLKAAEAGNINAMYFYGWMLTQYDVSYALVDKHYTNLLDEYMKAANEGNPEAMYNIGAMYEFGYGGLEESKETALEWYRKAAEAGYVEAMWYLYCNLWDFTYYLDGYSNYDEEREYWCTKAAKAGHPDAMNQYGRYLSDPVEAAEWYHKAVEAGNIDAMYSLFEIYLDGIGVEKNESIAWEWNVKYWEAYDNLPIGSHIRADTDMAKMVKNAMEWYKKAADNGNTDAMREIGNLSVNFSLRGMVQSGTIREDEQFNWYMKAAEAGDSEAMFNLGDLYETGNNVVDQDYNEAMKWYIKAYANGHDNAAGKINEMLISKQGLNGYFENYSELLSIDQ